MSNRCQIDAKLIPEEGKAMWIRGWGPGGLCQISPSKVYDLNMYVVCSVPSGHYSRDWSEHVNVIGVISEPFVCEVS